MARTRPLWRKIVNLRPEAGKKKLAQEGWKPEVHRKGQEETQDVTKDRKQAASPSSRARERTPDAEGLLLVALIRVQHGALTSAAICWCLCTYTGNEMPFLTSTNNNRVNQFLSNPSRVFFISAGFKFPSFLSWIFKVTNSQQELGRNRFLKNERLEIKWKKPHMLMDIYIFLWMTMLEYQFLPFTDTFIPNTLTHVLT